MGNNCLSASVCCFNIESFLYVQNLGHCNKLPFELELQPNSTLLSSEHSVERAPVLRVVLNCDTLSEAFSRPFLFCSIGKTKRPTIYLECFGISTSYLNVSQRCCCATYRHHHPRESQDHIHFAGQSLIVREARGWTGVKRVGMLISNVANFASVKGNIHRDGE